MASRYIHSEMAGAPQMGGNVDGSLNTVLKAVLVDGFGGVAPLGWDLVYTDDPTFTMVFRPKTGCRAFLQIQDKKGTGNYSQARVCAYESMSSALVGRFPIVPIGVDMKYISKSVNNSSASVPWFIIGDNLGFWLGIKVWHDNGTLAGSSHYILAYCGEYTYFTEYVSFNWIQWAQLQYVYTPHSSPFVLPFYALRNPLTSASGAVTLRGRSLTLNAGASVYTSGVKGRYMYSPTILDFVSSTTYYSVGMFPGLWNVHAIPFSNNLPGLTEFAVMPTMLPIEDSTDRMYVLPVHAHNSSIAYGGRVCIYIGERFRYVN